MTEIKFSTIFKYHSESYVFKDYDEGLYNYHPTQCRRIYGMKSEEEFPDEIDVQLYINKVYIKLIIVKKGEDLYNKMLAETEDIPIFVGLDEEIPDNTFWSIEHKGVVRENYSYWYKDGKFFSIGGNRYIRYTDKYSEINDGSTFFKDLESIAKGYLEWGSNYEQIDKISLVKVEPVLRDNYKHPIRKLRYPVLNIDPEKIYVIDKDGLVGAKYIGRSNKYKYKYDFEIFTKNESGDWINEGLRISRDDTNTFIPGSLTYSGHISGLDLEHTCVIICDNNDIIPISFINGNVALYDYVLGEFREINNADWDALDNIDIYRAGFDKIEGGDAK